MKKDILLGTLLCSSALMMTSQHAVEASTSAIKSESKKITITSQSAKLFKDSKLKSYSTIKSGTVYQVDGYRMINGKHYYRLYQTNSKGDKTYKGYLKSSDAKTLTLTRASKKYIAKKNTTLWNNLYYSQKKAVLNEEKSYFTKGYYKLGNGKVYYSIYQKDSKNKDKWCGYTYSGNLKELKSTSYNKTVTLTRNYNSWNNLYFTQKKNSYDYTKGLNYKAKQYYTIGGKKFYSLYRTDSQGKEYWCGYMNGVALKELTSKSIPTDQQQLVVKNDCSTYKDHYFHKKNTLKSKTHVIAKRSYTYGNGKTYYSIYQKDNNGKETWLGYVNNQSLQSLQSVINIINNNINNVIKQWNNNQQTIKLFVDDNNIEKISQFIKDKNNYDNDYQSLLSYKEKLVNQLKALKISNDKWIYSEDNNQIILEKYIGSENNIDIPEKFNNKKIIIMPNGKPISTNKNIESITMGNITLEGNLSNCFNGYKYLNNISFNQVNTKNVDMIDSIFANCDNLSNISGLENWDTSNVLSMKYIFDNCHSLTDISALENWNTSNVINMNGMFYNCNSLTDISALKNWNTSNVTYMEEIFFNCNSLTDISALKNWDTSSVTDMSHMFYHCKLTNVNELKNWNTSNVTYMSAMFANCDNLKDISALENWNTVSLTRMVNMFDGCNSLKDISPLKNWNISSVTDMSYLFNNCSQLTDISALFNWRNDNHPYMNKIFCNTNVSSNDIEQFMKNFNQS